MKKWYILKGIKFALLAAAGTLLMGYIMMSLWNWLVPALFSGPHITFIQAFGLFILSKMLFGGFKGRWGGGHCGCGHGGHRWKQRMEEKMSKLTPEEREKFRKHMSERCRGEWSWSSDEGRKTDGTDQ
ncbi:MAG: hypothetical protein JNL63_03705 [Bacteroidia bacterium]|nr:hypothetical protein [Bacteroidia bacterium]